MGISNCHRWVFLIVVKRSLLEARAELGKNTWEQDNQNYRALQINIGIALGDWNSLLGIIDQEWMANDRRSAQDLISIAQLAIHLNSPHAKGFIYAAADKGKDDADVLVAAYMLATKAGLESDINVFNWLDQAANLSGENGPIKKLTIKDFLDWKPDWDQRESEIWKLLTQGDIPSFLAAQSLNKSLIELTLVPALLNLSEKDPRRRAAIPAFCGNRQPILLGANMTVGIDATALITLNYLGLLDKTLDKFGTIYLPHSTLAWLFEEKQRAAFHQPSRILCAHQVRNMLSTDVLEKLIPSTVPNSELSAQVGDELALLISEAEKQRENDNIQRIVVRPSPVHLIGSFMMDEADLSSHAGVLSSCQTIVSKLRQKGQITAEEEKKAQTYLKLQEKPWPHQPEIADEAILYLDSLAITYFLHSGILERLKPAGFKPIVSLNEISETNGFILYETISDKVKDAIENIRSSIHTRIESGKIKVGRKHNLDKSETLSFSEHPTIGVFALVGDCDAIIVDDRALNQHTFIEGGSQKAQIYSTVDILDALVSLSSITHEEYLEYRTQLRRAEYFLVPLNNNELLGHLNASTVKDNQVIETAELKAIRENLLCVRMSSWLQLPKEAYWLDTALQTFIQVLNDLWISDTELSTVRARSEWILDQVDTRGWAHRLGFENRDHFVSVGRGANIMKMFMPLQDVSMEVQENYWNWIEEKILLPIKEQNPDLYSWIVDLYKRQIAKLSDTYLAGGGGQMMNSYIRSRLANAVLENAPPIIRKTLLEDQDFRREYSLEADAVLAFGNSGISFQRSDLFAAVRKLLSGTMVEKVIDTNGQIWDLKNTGEEGGLLKPTLYRDNQNFTLPELVELSPDSSTRLQYLEEAAFDVNLPRPAAEFWHNILIDRALLDDEVDLFQSEFRETPIGKMRLMHDEAASGQINFTTLVPPSLRYFERLVGSYDGSHTIRDYAVGNGRVFLDQLSQWQPYYGFLYSLLLSSHSLLSAEITIDQLSEKELLHAFEFLIKHGDRLSQVGAVEVGLRVLPSRPDIEPFILDLIKQIRDDDVDGQMSGFKLLSSLFVFVDGELSRKRLLSTTPPFYRRLAALSQAALIHRVLKNTAVDINKFGISVLNSRAEQYYMQSYVDMRLEPRWNPDFASAFQLKADFIGRILLAGRKYEQNITNSELSDLVLGTQPGSLQSLIPFLYPYLPGPLEGVLESQSTLPKEFAAIIEEQLGAKEVGPSSFIALVNSALIFHIGTDLAGIAARVLKLGNYRLTKLEDKNQLLSILNGLATVAAVSRSKGFADEIHILVRRYRRDPQYALSVEEIMRICLVASASCADLTEWSEYVGNWLTELSFSNLEDNEGGIFLSHLRCLCHAAPELWGTCGRADAALVAYNSSLHA